MFVTDKNCFAWFSKFYLTSRIAVLFLTNLLYRRKHCGGTNSEFYIRFSCCKHNSLAITIPLLKSALYVERQSHGIESVIEYNILGSYNLLLHPKALLASHMASLYIYVYIYIYIYIYIYAQYS